MEVWWIAFGGLLIASVFMLWLYQRKMKLEVETLKADHHQSLQILEQEGEKRVLRIERASAVEKARAEHHLIRDLMPLADALDRALDVDVGADAESVRKGIELVSKELATVFVRHGVDRLEPEEGEAFDPMLHEAVEHRVVDGDASNQIVQCFRTGYRQGDDVLRPAMVAVGARQPEVVFGVEVDDEESMEIEADASVSAHAD